LSNLAKIRLFSSSNRHEKGPVFRAVQPSPQCGQNRRFIAPQQRLTIEPQAGKTPLFIPMSVQDETKARRIPGGWRGASEAHIRSDLQRASNEASRPEDKRISLILNGIWN
jgi:hypothetical protein